MTTDSSSGRILRVATLFGGGASAAVGLVESENHGKKYEVVAGASSVADAAGINRLGQYDIPVGVFGYEQFCNDHGIDPKKRDSNLRYHEEKIMPFIVEANPDVVLLSGYFRILPDFFLEQFPDTKNTHCMDLSWIAQREQKDSPLVRYRQLRYVGGQDPNAVAQLEDVERAFKGESAVFDLLQSARIIRPHPKLRATVHRAIPEYDEGLIEVQSAPVEVDWDLAQRLGRTRNWGELMKYADLLQGELKVKGDIPATITAIELTSDGRLDHHDGAVYVDDIRMPVHGLRLDKWEDPKRVET